MIASPEPLYQPDSGLSVYCDNVRYRRFSIHKGDAHNVFGREFQPAGERQQNDRRQSDRFPIEREVRYKILNKRAGEETGAGKTVNMSSAGVLFTTEQMLIPGKRVEIAINWPAQLNSKCALKLVARGRVVRCDNSRAAIEIQQYEFRTAGAAATA